MRTQDIGRFLQNSKAPFFRFLDLIACFLQPPLLLITYASLFEYEILFQIPMTVASAYPEIFRLTSILESSDQSFTKPLSRSLWPVREPGQKWGETEHHMKITTKIVKATWIWIIISKLNLLWLSIFIYFYPFSLSSSFNRLVQRRIFAGPSLFDRKETSMRLCWLV